MTSRPRGVACLRTVAREHGFEPLTPRIGAVPRALDGRLHQVGPGRFEAGPTRYRHWFDGEGLVAAIDVADGAARAALRLAAPAGVDADDYPRRGRFGTPPAGAWRRVKALWDPSIYVNPANTALMVWRDRLFALYEGDWPTELDPETLATIGATDLGVVQRAFSAHPKAHRPTGDLINQGFHPAPRNALRYYRLPSTGAPTLLAEAPYAGSVMTHDFAVTDRFIVSVCPPLFVDVPAIVLGGRSISEGVRWRPERGTELVVTPIDAPERTRRLTVAPRLYSHTANAYEDGDEIVIHGVVAEDAANFRWVGSVRRDAAALAPSTSGRLTEIRIDPSAGRADLRTLFDEAIDFPTIDDRVAGVRHRFVYAAGFRDEAAAYRDLFDVLVKFDLETGDVRKIDFGDGHFVSEAAVATRPGAVAEDDVWLLCVNYDAGADESYVAILDARGAPELVAALPLGQATPICFHSLWRARRRS